MRIAAVVAVGIGAGTASAQNVLVPHRGHYHVVPAYSPQYYGGFGYRSYSYPTYSGFYGSPGISFGYSPGFGYGAPAFGGVGGYYGGGWGGHHRHGHYHHGGHHHR